MRGFSRLSLQTTHILRAYNVLSIHGWSQVKPAENYDVVYEQPQRPWDVNMVSPQKQTPLLRSWGPWKNLARPRHGIFESMWWGKVFFFSKYSYCRILKLGILIIFFWGQGGLERTLQARLRLIWINAMLESISLPATKYLWGQAILNGKSYLKCPPNRDDYGNTLYWCWICGIFKH